MERKQTKSKQTNDNINRIIRCCCDSGDFQKMKTNKANNVNEFSAAKTNNSIIYS